MLQKRDLLPSSKEWGWIKAAPLQRAGAAGAAGELGGDGGTASRGPLAAQQAAAGAPGTASAAVVVSYLSTQVFAHLFDKIRHPHNSLSVP